MKTILLIRGVNVGGVKLPMAGFRALLAEMGCRDVQSYIQSGQAVYEAPQDPGFHEALARAMPGRFGISPTLFPYDLPRYEAILNACPFAAEGAASGKSVHVFYLAAPSPVDAGDLDPLRAPGERFVLTPEAFYLHAPDGVGRSVLVEKLPKLLRVAATARNWNTVLHLRAMARGEARGTSQV